MRASGSLLLRRLTAATAVAAAVPLNYSNIPYQKQPREEADGRSRRTLKKDSTQFTSSAPLTRLTTALPPPPPPLRSTFIRPSHNVTSVRSADGIHSFRHAVSGAADVSMRPLQFLSLTNVSPVAAPAAKDARAKRADAVEKANSFGERLRDQLSCRWAAKFYGQVTFGPRNYPYPSSRWLARRFKMKKHRIIKRFRFRRYKLAAVANLPFAKMIRVGMLPELKSSKTKKGDAVDAGLSAQLVSAAKSTAGGKTKGKRSRPKSKYQV